MDPELDELLHQAILYEFQSSKNPFLTKETVVARVLHRLAARANVNFPPLDPVPRPCILDEAAHSLVLDMWEKRRGHLVPSVEEQQCMERVLGRDKVRPSDLIKSAQYLMKNCESNADTVNLLFAVDGCRGEDVKNYVDTFFCKDDVAKTRHVNQVRIMLSKLNNPKNVKYILEKVWNDQTTGDNDEETEFIKQYREAMGSFNVRDWRMNSDEVVRRIKKRKTEEETEE